MVGDYKGISGAVCLFIFLGLYFGPDWNQKSVLARADAVDRRYSIGAVPRLVAPVAPVRFRVVAVSRLAQLVERKTLNLVVVGSSPTVGVHFNFCKIISPIFFNSMIGPPVTKFPATGPQPQVKRAH